MATRGEDHIRQQAHRAQQPKHEDSTPPQNLHHRHASTYDTTTTTITLVIAQLSAVTRGIPTKTPW
jgi:hypothetical protein